MRSRSTGGRIIRPPEMIQRGIGMNQMAKTANCLLLLMTALLPVSCGNQSADSPDEANDFSNSPLALRLNEGDVYRMRFIRNELIPESQFAEGWGASPLSVKVDYHFEVLQVESGGAARVRATFEGFDIGEESIMSLFSGQEIFDLLRTRSFEFELAPDGMISGLKGHDLIFDQFVELILDAEEMKEILAQGLPGMEELALNSEEDAKVTFESLIRMIMRPYFDIYAGEKSTLSILGILFSGNSLDSVEVGDKWTDTRPAVQSFGSTLPSRNEWEILELDDENTTIGSAFRLQTGKSVGMMSFGLVELDLVLLGGNGNSEIHLDPNSGWPTSGEISLTYSGDLQTKLPEGSQADRIEGEVEITFELLESTN